MDNVPLDVHIEDGVASPAHVGACRLKHLHILVGEHAPYKTAVKVELHTGPGCDRGKLDNSNSNGTVLVGMDVLVVTRQTGLSHPQPDHRFAASLVDERQQELHLKVGSADIKAGQDAHPQPFHGVTPPLVGTVASVGSGLVNIHHDRTSLRWKSLQTGQGPFWHKAIGENNHSHVSRPGTTDDFYELRVQGRFAAQEADLADVRALQEIQSFLQGSDWQKATSVGLFHRPWPHAAAAPWLAPFLKVIDCEAVGTGLIADRADRQVSHTHFLLPL